MSFTRTTKEKKEVFILHPQESQDAKTWMAKHLEMCPSFQRKGRSFRYVFIPNSIGTTIIIECPCGAECDVTQYDMW